MNSPASEPLQNRVTPEGLIIATCARGTLMGNRGGAIHTAERTLSSRRWASRQWIACRLSFKGRRRNVMSPGRYTELFFLDEATAFSAGHRPCFECRRTEALAFAVAFAAAEGTGGRAGAAAMDRRLHAERLLPDGSKRMWTGRLADLPDGAFVRLAAGPHLVHGRLLVPWTPDGYGEPCRPDPDTLLTVLTPPVIVAVLSSGYSPNVHPSASVPQPTERQGDCA